MSNEPEKFWQVHIEIPSEWAEEAAGWLITTEASGAEILDPTSPFCRRPEWTEGLKQNHCLIVASYEGEDDFQSHPDSLRSHVQQSLAQLNTDLLPLKINCHQRFTEDWAENWKQFFAPLALGRSYWVRAPWHEEVAPKGRKTIVIEPAMAFGTGQHPTTALCMELIESMQRRQASSATVLDVGTGSGILAFAALLGGARQSLGVDIDNAALKNARLNRSLNEINPESFRIEETALEDIPETFDWVFANILAPILIDLSSLIWERVAPSGQLLLSGLLKTQEEEVMAAYQRAAASEQTPPPRQVLREEKDDWVALVLKKESA